MKSLGPLTKTTWVIKSFNWTDLEKSFKWDKVSILKTWIWHQVTVSSTSPSLKWHLIKCHLFTVRALIWSIEEICIRGLQLLSKTSLAHQTRSIGSLWTSFNNKVSWITKTWTTFMNHQMKSTRRRMLFHQMVRSESIKSRTIRSCKTTHLLSQILMTRSYPTTI